MYWLTRDQRILCGTAIELIFLGVEYAILISMKPLDHAQWDQDEADALVDHLYNRRWETGKAGNFPTSTYDTVAELIEPLLKYGTPEDGTDGQVKMDSCKRFPLILLMHLIMCISS